MDPQSPERQFEVAFSGSEGTTSDRERRKTWYMGNVSTNNWIQEAIQDYIVVGQCRTAIKRISKHALCKMIGGSGIQQI
jgi:hypothetical protein